MFTLLLAMPTALGIGATPALAQGDGSAVAGGSTPMLDALSLMPPFIDAFEFTHWHALKAAHGGADVTAPARSPSAD